MSMPNNSFQDFYQNMSRQGESLDDIQTASEIHAVEGFPQTCGSFDEIPTVDYSYPIWGEAEATPLSLVVAAEPTYPVGFDSAGQFPNIFGWEKKSANKPLRLTDVKNGIMQDTTGLNLSEIADAILRLGNFMEIQRQLAYYEPPRWRFVDKGDATQVIMRVLNQIDSDIANIIRHHHLIELYQKLTISPNLKHMDVFPIPDYHMLCCRDGMYCWPQGAILAHDSQYYRFSYLNISAEDIAPQDTPYFDIFLENVAQGDTGLRQLILEVIGVILSGYPCKQFFVFQGASNSGKSQLASFLRDVLGPVSCYAVNGINQLSDTRVTAELPGKLLLLCSDVPDVGLKADAVAIIKELTGGDPIFANPKYKQPFCFNNSSKLLFLSNFPLRSYKGALDEAFLNRMLQIPFQFSVPKEQQIEDLHKKLFDEAGGILWKSLDALQALEERNGIFTKIAIEPHTTRSPMSVPTAQERVMAFFEARCVMESSASISVTMLYSEFLAFDQQEYPDLVTIPKNIFSRTLYQCGLPIHEHRTSSGRGYFGIRLK